MSEARAPAPDGASSLARIVALEAHRADVGFRPDPARLAAGWTFRFVADGRRTAESVALYEALGFEVCTTPLEDMPIAAGCAACRLAAAFAFRAIYTRPGRG